ncbi:MAG: SDR family oxidoreductase [Sphingomicrobium sp.]
MSFSERTGLRVLISGISDGVGLPCALAFAERGAELILCDIDSAALTRANDMLGGFSRYCDVISEMSVAAFAHELKSKFSEIDVIINAAGRGYVRTLGMVHLSNALMPLLGKSGSGGMILNIAPAGGYVSTKTMFPYAGSQKGFQCLSDAIAAQVKDSPISVISLVPKLRRKTEHVATNKLYRLERIDEDELVDRVIAAIGDKWPQWQRRRSPLNRRA